MRLNFCLRAADYLGAAPHDPEAAASALLLAAEYLRAGEPVPDNLADWLAGALESAALKPAAARAGALARELHLTAGNRRPVACWLEVGGAFDLLVLDGKSQNAAKAEIARRFGIDESTAVRYWRQHCKAREEHDRITREG